MVALAGDGRTSLPGGRRNGVSTFRERRRRKIAPEARRRGCYAGECAGLSGPIDMWRTWFYAKNMGAMVQIRNVPEALHRLTEIYLTLGLTDQARRTAAVLGHNYPGSRWYEDSYNQLVADGAVKNATPAAQRPGFFARTLGSIF